MTAFWVVMAIFILIAGGLIERSNSRDAEFKKNFDPTAANRKLNAEIATYRAGLSPQARAIEDEAVREMERASREESQRWNALTDDQRELESARIREDMEAEESDSRADQYEGGPGQ